MRAAEAAGLRYVTDAEPGITRRRCGRGWSYRSPRGKTIRDRRVRERIEALAIPPAWDDVWICPDPKGHIQATGRDSEGRKQYRYHAAWNEIRSAAKFHRLLRFGEALPRIRRRVAEALARPGLPREKVLAAVVRLLETTCIRVGNDEYERRNGTYGLTTIRARHVELEGSKIRFRFTAKGGIDQEVDVRDPRLARIVRQCEELPGQDLFGYVDEDGEPRDVTADAVNDYLEEISGERFTANDFRTWMGTLLAFLRLCEAGPAEDERSARAACSAALEGVAEELQNTRDVTRLFYVHPGLESYEQGEHCDRFEEEFPDDPPEHMDAAEVALLALLEDIALATS